MAKKSTSIESLPAWVALSAGIVYATGFLIQFTYLNSIGIKESVTEPFKAKYIYLGLLCWQFPLCVALLLVGCGLAKSRAQREHEAVTSAGIHRTPEEEKKHKTEDSDTRVYWASMLIFVILLFIFYLFMLFSPPGFFFARQRWVVGFCIFVYIALNALRRTENWIEAVVTSEPTLKKTLGHLIPNSDHLTVGKMIRVALFVVALGLMVFTFDPFDPKKFWAKLFEMFLNEGYWYFVFLGIAASLFWFAFRGSEPFFKHRLNFKYEYMAMALPVPMTFLYLSVLAFACHIYPYVPSERGGGDFTEEKASILTFDPRYLGSVPSDVIDGTVTNVQSKKAVILDETADTIYVAVPTGITEVAAWRQNVPPAPDHPNSRPGRIVAIKRDAVASVRTESW